VLLAGKSRRSDVASGFDSVRNCPRNRQYYLHLRAGREAARSSADYCQKTGPWLGDGGSSGVIVLDLLDYGLNSAVVCSAWEPDFRARFDFNRGRAVPPR